MTPERYRKIGELYHAALEVKPDVRGDFLDRECAGDEALRSEVESLIASHEHAPSDFIARPALAVAAGMIVQTESLVGQTLGHYRVLSLVGEGGMGQVYLAEDMQLGRRVALKLLSAAFTNDEPRMRRFTQEARAASALNHPNILTVHEIGNANGIDFIATEFIEGETLRPSIAKRRLKLSHAVDIAAQVAEALGAAHAAGVVHRDIKPENVMLRPDGYVKVLDFGLAKLGSELHTGTEASTITKIETNPGVVMGTVQYMSPEQARALAADGRTDVWSLGVMLYELVANVVPFSGETPSDTIVGILEKEPVPLALQVTGVPSELERIVMKALTKNKDERYQTIKDMAIDLRRLRRRLDVDAEIGRYALAETNTGEPGAAGRVSGSESTPALTVPQGTAAATSSVEYLVNGVKRHKGGAALIAVLLIAVFAGLAYGLYWFKFKDRSSPRRAEFFQTTNMTRLTTEGQASDVAISPDGKYVVYVKSENSRESLWMKHLATGSDVQSIPPSEIGYLGITFSPDGDYVYYVTNEKSGEGALYQMPVIGGASRKVLAGIAGRVSFSPAGDRFAFVRPAQGAGTLVVANTDGTGQQVLASRKVPNNFWPMPAWSPDGKVIACAARSYVNGFHFELVGVQIEDRKERLISRQRWHWVDHLMWLPDSSGLMITGTDQPARTPQVWRLPYPEGEPVKITNDLNTYEGLSLTRASNALVTVSSTDISNIWIAPVDRAGPETQLTSGVGRYDGAEGISWTSDGKIVFRSWAKGTNDLWIIERDGSKLRQLLVDDPVATGLSISRNDQYLVVSSGRGGNTEIWRTDLDGGNAKQLTSGGGGGKFRPDFSPNGEWVVYTFLSDYGPTIWRVPVDGGVPLRLFEKAARSQSVSPDGKLIACLYFGDQRRAVGLRMAVIPFEGGPPVKIFDVRLTPFSKWRSFGSLDTIRWSPDGRALTYIESQGGVSNIWSQPLNGSKPVQLTNFKTGRIFNFDWSPDGKWLALARGTITSDVVLINDLR